MDSRRRILQVVLATAVVLAALGVVQAQNSSEVISVINGQKITRADLLDKEGGRLLQPRQDLYQAEEKALDELIAERLLEQEAKKQHLTTDELLQKEVYSKIPDPTDDQLRVIYEVTNAASQPYDQIKNKLIEYVRNARRGKARIAYLDALRAKNDVLVLLAPPRTEVTAGNSPRVGPANAPVQLIEYADYECPYCIKVYPTVKKLQAEFGDRVSFVFKNFPLPMHADAQKAAEAAMCAAAQDKFWAYHDKLFSSTQLDVATLKKSAADLKLDTAKFDTCLDKGTEAARVQQDADEAQKLGLTGTPSFFLNGRFFSGAIDYKTLKDMIDQELASADKTKDKEKQSAAVKGAGQ